MTKKFDDKAREDLKNSMFSYNLQWGGQKPKDMVIRKMSVKEARWYIYQPIIIVKVCQIVLNMYLQGSIEKR